MVVVRRAPKRKGERVRRGEMEERAAPAWEDPLHALRWQEKGGGGRRSGVRRPANAIGASSRPNFGNTNPARRKYAPLLLRALHASASPFPPVRCGRWEEKRRR